MPIKRFDPDIYKGRKNMRDRDFAAGFGGSSLFWWLFFHPLWWAAPLAIFCLAMAGIVLQFRRRYFLYGALSLVFLPLIAWASLTIGWAGRNEVNS